MNTLCNDCSLPSRDNELEILVRRLASEVEKLVKDTTARLLVQDGKIAEACVYIKENLSNELRNLLDVVKFTGELDEIITSTVLNEVELIKINFENIFNIKKFGIQCDHTYTNNLNAIIDSLPEGAILYFPKGVYKFKTDSSVMMVNKPITIIGDGEDTTIIQNEGSGNIIDIKLETEEKRFVYIERLTLDEVNKNGKCVEVLSKEDYYLAQFRMKYVKTINGTHGFYLNGVTNDNLFISSFENCTIWNGFYANKIGDTIKISNCQFAFNGGVYINQVAGASSLEFTNNNVTCTDGFIIETASAPLLEGNIFEFTRPTNNPNGYVEIVPNEANRQYEFNINSNTFSYGANFTQYNKPLLYVGRVGKTNIVNNTIGVRDGNYSVILSNLSNSVTFDSTFGVAYSGDVIKYGLLNNGVNNIIVGQYIDDEFVDGKVTSKCYEKYITRKSITGKMQLIDTNPIFGSKDGITLINHGKYVDEYHTENEKVVGAITDRGILSLDLLIGGLTNHVRVKFMQGALPTENLEAGDVFINKSPSDTLPYLFYFYNGSTFKGVGELKDI